MKLRLKSLGALTLALTSVCCAIAQLPAPKPPLPQPIPLPAPVEAPRDAPYPGVIELHIDATDVLRRIYRVHETIPVSKAGTQTLLFPEWTPGDHAPNEPLEKLAGLVFTANETRLHWHRDAVNVHAFSVDVPAGITRLDVEYQYLGATGPMTGPVLITPTMFDLQWQSVILYPAGHFSRDIIYRPSITLPKDWAYSTSMDGGRRAPEFADNTIVFPALNLEALIDQPVMAARYLKQVMLFDNPVPVRLDVAAQGPDDLAGLPEAAKRFASVVPQAYKLFDSRHYDHYDCLLFLSEELSTYFEHHRSGEMALPADYLKTVPKSTADAADLSYLVHGFVHSWNGMYRRPGEMWTPNLNTPERDSMLWVFEGLTNYWATVLSFRAGFHKQDEVADQFSDLAALMTLDAGANWRTLADVNNDAVILGRRQGSWPSWQRNMFDSYNSGEMIWLEADALIREESGDKKSLDNFARNFFSGKDNGDVTRTYSFDDMVAALSAVQPYDWHAFFKRRLDDYGGGSLAYSINRAGYELVFTGQSGDDGPPSTYLDLAYSLGMRVNSTGFISAVHWGGPAFKANLELGETILSVNGKPYAPALFTQAIEAAAHGGPLDLVVQRGKWQQRASIVWEGGMRYPHLRRIVGTPALLDESLAPL